MWSLGVIIYIMLCGYPPFYGECESENCGWDQGEQCTDCQDSLFHRIQRGDFDFPEEEWANISREAKDLISHLLVKNVRQRYTADDVLKHPWVVHGAPKTPLLTANNLFRNDSTRDMHQMQEHFNVMSRFNQVHEEGDSCGSPTGASPLLPLSFDNYVVPAESHHSNLHTGGAPSIEGEVLSSGNSPPAQPMELIVSERSLPTGVAEGAPQAASNLQLAGLLTSARPAANRQQSSSPSIRRLPATHLKETTGSSRKDNSPSKARPTDAGDPPPLGTASFDTRPARTKVRKNKAVESLIRATTPQIRSGILVS
jgi:serine/threonine protein kinase